MTNYEYCNKTIQLKKLLNFVSFKSENIEKEIEEVIELCRKENIGIDKTTFLLKLHYSGNWEIRRKYVSTK